MAKLQEFVLAHVERGACTCGRCGDAPENPKERQPEGHTADMGFFKVKTRGEPSADALRQLISEHKGSFGEVDPFDGKEHNYLELGGWLGDQGIALMFMGLGHLLGLWKLLTPMSMLGLKADDDAAQELLGMGMLSIQASKERPQVVA